MKRINQYILEKFKISRNTKLITERDVSVKNGACIENDLERKYQFMYYDPMSGMIGGFDCDSAEDLIKEWSYEDAAAKRLVSLKVGQSDYDRQTNAIVTRIC